MSSTLAKRPRRSARLAGLPVPVCPIVDLPLEILECITAHLDCDELYSLASTSKLFRNTYRLRAVLAKLEYYALCDWTSWWDGELFCLSDAEPGQFGWSPFVLLLSEDSLSEDGQCLETVVVSPTFDRFDRDSPTDAYLFIQQTEREVWLKDEYFSGAAFENDAARILDWDEDLAGRLVRATPKLLETRFKCPECDGKGEVIVGNREIAGRWPLLLGAGFEYEVPCPRCQITYRSAVELQEEVDADIEAECEARYQEEMEAAFEAGELSDSYYG